MFPSTHEIWEIHLYDLTDLVAIDLPQLGSSTAWQAMALAMYFTASHGREANGCQP